MQKTQSIEEFYQSKLNRMPGNLKKGMGHFNAFVLDDFVGRHAKPIPYSRKDYFKITLLKGRNHIHYADKTVYSEHYALLFANPMIPYNWEPMDGAQSGFFCIFTEAFFNQFGSIKDYPVFQSGYNKVFILSEENLAIAETIYHKMLEEIASDYTYKFDVLRSLVFDLVHLALKTESAAPAPPLGSNAAIRTASFFTELLERQFPIESPLQRMGLRAPKDFAAQLAVHTNHLNRSLKKITGKTTSQLIAERILQESRMLLRHTDWNISEIGWCLGFEELSHFIHFFKKNTSFAPSVFRNLPES